MRNFLPALVLYLVLFPISALAQYQLNGNAVALGGDCFRLTNNTNSQFGSVWYLNQVNLNQSFEVLGRVFLGCNNAGADGLTFTLQQVSTSAGASGGGLGYQGITPSIAVEFDTYTNGNFGDPNYDHMAVISMGSVAHNAPTNLAGPVGILPGNGNVEDCMEHDVRFTWDPASMTFRAYVDCQLRLTYVGNIVGNIFNNNPNVFWGFTAGTGAAFNEHRVCLDFSSFLYLQDTTVCLGDTLTLDAGPGSTYSWTPTSGLSNPNIGTPMAFPDTTTTYYVSVTDNCGLTRNDTMTITLGGPSLLDFEADTVCFSFPTTFTNQTQECVPNTYHWDFGGGNTSTLANPVHTFSAPGIFPVQLIGNGNGTIDTVVKNVVVLAAPTVDFTANNVCLGDPVLFMDNSTPAVSWLWDFDDGTGSVNQNPQTLYGDTGTYSVQLIVTNMDGCVDSVTKTVTVYPSPTAEFVADTVCNSFPTQFTSGSYGNGSPVVQWYWTFGDGTNSPNQNPSHTYGGFGTFNVMHVATDFNGCTDTAFSQAVVYPPLTADFNATNVCLGNGSNFFDQSLADPLGPIVSWAWTFGDGSVSSLASPSHTYASQGVYPVTLTITSIHGCTDAITQNIEVFEHPTAGFTFQPVCAGNAVNFSNQSQTSDPAPVWTWNFGDGSPNGNLPSPSHVYNAPGIYTVALTITTSDGCQDTYEAPVSIYASPTANFTLPLACEGNIVGYQSLSTVTPPGMITSYNWDLGNGLSSVTLNPIATYPIPGSYPITLSVTTNNGCFDEVTKVLVVNPKPKPAFTANVVCQGEPTEFENLSTIFSGSISSWDWNFGDGSTSAQQDPSHVFGSSGLKQVTLTAISDAGCTQVVTGQVQVLPIPDFVVLENDTICPGTDALLVAIPVSGAHAEWFTDITATQPFFRGLQNEISGLTQSTTYYVQAIAGNNGCSSGRIPIGVVVLDPPVTEILTNVDVVEFPDSTIAFTVPNPNDFASMEWEFGDGMSQIGSSVIHSYRLPGIYTVRLLVVDKDGCLQVLYKQVEVKEVVSLFMPSAFTPNGDGYNDFYFIGSARILSLTFQVFNRWGQLVYETEDPQFRWNGDSNQGIAASEGVYVYKVSAYDLSGNEIIKSGTITLIR